MILTIFYRTRVSASIVIDDDAQLVRYLTQHVSDPDCIGYAVMKVK